MIQYLSESGQAIPATVLSATPMTVTAVRTKEKEGYTAVQVGMGNKKRLSKPEKGHFGRSNAAPRHVREFRLPDASPFSLGQEVLVSEFSPGDKVLVSGITKGKGFQGVVKRHGFKGGPRTHGQKHSEREAGSIGATWPQRVLKGKRMAGKMGETRITVKNLTVLAVDPETNGMVVSGAVPGRRGTLLEIRSVS